MIDLNYIKKSNQGKVVILLNRLKEHSIETYKHSLDVAETSVAIGKFVGLDMEQLQMLYTAGCLHDIGKLAVSSALLHKKGCTPEEVNYIRYTHIDFTYLLLKDQFDKSIVNICYHHHERLNGKGYPQGLKANKLTENDKIVQVADVVSALVLDRSYRTRKYNVPEAKQILDRLVKKGDLDPFYVNIVKIAVLDKTYIPQDSKRHFNNNL